MMFPKSKPRDPAFMRQFRKAHKCCEICGAIHNLEIAHIISKGSGGPDMPENVLMLDGPAALQMGCHGGNHICRAAGKSYLRLRLGGLGSVQGNVSVGCVERWGMMYE